MGEPVPTTHGSRRVRSRIGLKKKAVLRMTQRAMSCAVERTSTSGSLRRYLDKLYFSYDSSADTIKIFANYVWLFSKDLRLITVLLLPVKYRGTVGSLSKEVNKDYVSTAE